MKVFSSWGGPGQGYDFIDPGDDRKTANQYGRQDTNPTASFRFKQGIGSVMAPGANNSGDSKAAQEMSGQGSFVTSKPGDSMGSA